MAKTLWSFGLSECNRVKDSIPLNILYIMLQESPTSSEKISPLSPEQRSLIEKSLRSNQGFDQQRASPIKKALKTGKNLFSKLYRLVWILDSGSSCSKCP